MNEFKFSLFFSVFLLLLGVGFSAWHEFNYDPVNSGTYNGYNPILYVKYNTTLWTANISTSEFQKSPSPAYSSGDLSGTSVIPDTVYIAGDDPNTLYALNASSGEQLWNFTAPIIGSAGGFIASPVVYTDNSTNITYVIIGNENTFLYAINASSGEQIWNTTLYGPIYPTSAVYNNIVYAAAGAAANPDFFAINITDGSIIWSYSASGVSSRSSPTVYNGMVYFTMSRPSNNSVVYALNATNGSYIWNYTIPTSGVEIWSSPAISPSLGILYIGVNDGRIYALNATTGTQIWNFSFYNFSANIVSTPSVLDCSLGSLVCGIVFVGADGIYALNASTGSVIWQFNESGFVMASTPAFSKDVVYAAFGNAVGNEGRVYALDVSTGTPLWVFYSGAKISASPALVNMTPYNILYIQDVNGVVYAIGKDEPPVIEVLTPNTTSYTNSTYLIRWNASDPNGDSLNISCYGDNDSSGFDKIETCFENTTNDGNEVCDTSAWNEGTYYIWCSAYDGVLYGYDYANSTLTVDRTPPLYYNQSAYPPSPATYSPNASYQFNITWIDNNVSIDSVWIEHNFTGTFQNYSVNLSTGSIFIYNYSDLSAALYSYKWYANDSLGNVNSTPYYNYTVQKATPGLTLSLNPSNTVSYGSQTNVSCTADSLQYTINLYRNGTLVATGTGYVEEVATLAAGTYNYSCNATESENYTSASTSSLLIVNKASPPLTLSILPSSSVTEGTQTNVSCTSSDQLNISLYINGTLVDSGFGYVENVSILGIGEYNITCNTTGNENYTSGENSTTLRVVEASSSEPSDDNMYISYEILCPENLITFSITDSSGDPLNNVKSILEKEVSSTYQEVETKYTDDDGEVSFTILEEGDYKLVAYLSGYNTGEKLFTYSLCEESNLTNITNETNISYNFSYNYTNITKNITENTTKNQTNESYEEKDEGEEKEERKDSSEYTSGSSGGEEKIESASGKGIKLEQTEEEFIKSRKKAGALDYMYSLFEETIFSKSCCFFTICSIFGFSSFLGICWYVWVALILIFAFAYLLYKKLKEKEASASKRYYAGKQRRKFK